MNKTISTVVIAAIFIVLTACSAAKPKIVALDNIPSHEARHLVSKSVRIVWPDEALRFDDASIPTPLQIVVPRRNASSFSELFFRPEYHLRLFANGGPSRLTMVHAIAGTKEMCAQSGDVYSFNNYLTDIEDDVVIRCGDLVFGRSGESEKSLFTQIATVAGEVTVNESSSLDSSEQKILIKYLKQQTNGF